jgi:hypothetical protein
MARPRRDHGIKATLPDFLRGCGREMRSKNLNGVEKVFRKQGDSA